MYSTNQKGVHMTYRNKTEQQMTLTDAVEALSTIVDLEPAKHSIASADDYQLLSDRLKRWSEKPTIENENNDMELVKNIFGTILYHLKNLYVDESLYIADEQKNKQVKTIMLLVGEAASRLDRLTGLFHDTQLKSVHELKEFKQLQEFYINRVARKIDTNLLGKWILGIQGKAASDNATLKPALKTLHTEHVFIDLEGVKKDTEYELFFIRKEDGTRFFDPKLIRSIKLVCDFDSYFKNGVLDDPFADIHLVVDRNLQITAKNMIANLSNTIGKFYREMVNYKKNEIVHDLQNAIMALLLASNKKNLLRNNPHKSCFEYFVDFQLFLRKALQTREYHRMIAYPDLSTGASNPVKEMLNDLVISYYTAKQEMHSEVSFVENIIHEATGTKSEERSSKLLEQALTSDYNSMSKMIKTHPNGHLKKILEMVENGNTPHFDPLFQQNIPMEMYTFYVDSTKMVNIRLPAPIAQENIQKVWINDEFKAFLRSLKEAKQKLLMYNCQDKTSWREHSRAKALEDLHKNPEFTDNFIVISIPKDTEFYLQAAPYNKESHADVFMDNLKGQLVDESSGFYFPKAYDLHSFIDRTIKAVHGTFFQSKNVLTRDQRLDFIEIFYFFLELKILDICKPNYFSFTCKDAIDISGASNACFFTFLKLFNQEKLAEKDMEFMNFLIYAIPITVRERLMLRERFTRMASAIKCFETTKSFDVKLKEVFGELYDGPILDSKFSFGS